MTGTSRWTLRTAAEIDLSDIWHYSADTWGIAQADRYSDTLFAVFDLLAEFPEMARERSELSPPVRIHPSGKHLVIYLWAGNGIEIIRVLHAHQNLQDFISEA
jgi:toxin ParE1/3/4